MGRMPPYSDEGMRGRLALAIILMVSACLGALLFLEIPGNNRELLSAVIGALLMRLADVYGYSFGSSAGRDRQADTMHAQAQALQTATRAAAAEPDALVLEPGDQATVTPTEDGTTVQKETQ